MKAPLVHYDHVLQAHPEWRITLTLALMGNHRRFEETVRAMYLVSPAGARTLLAMYGYATCGKQVFCVGPKLQQMFAETDLTNIPREFLNLPFPAYFIATPDCPWRIWGGQDTGWHEVGGMYVVVPAEKPTCVRLIMWGKENEKSIEVGDDATFWIDIDLAAKDAQAGAPDEDGIARLDLEAYLDHLLGSGRNDGSDPGMRAEGAIMDQQFESTRKLVRLAFCLLLYLNSENPEARKDASFLGKRAAITKQIAGLSNPKKRRLRQRELDALPDCTVTWIGEGAEQDEDPAIESADTSRAPGSTGRVQRRHLRRGHFHHFWAGKRKDASGQRVKGDHLVQHWVKPVWAGADMADMVRARGRVYRLKEDKER